MLTPPRPVDEEERLQSLQETGLLDTLAEERFDRVTRLATRLFGVPIALVSLVDRDRQWFKSKQGLDATETPRDISFCGHAILEEQPLVVADALDDGRFADNPLVVGDPGIRFYAGYPIASATGHRLGTLCLIDREPRKLDGDELQLLEDLGRLVEEQISALRMATVDELTGLSNRRGFSLLADQALRVCRRLGRPATLLYFDLDDFKAINDSHGHGAGDGALIEMSGLLRESFRESDVIGRIGGDEFCVLMVGADEHQGRPIDALQRSLRERNAARESTFELGCSIGAVRYDPSRHDSLEALMADGDRRMYESKRWKQATRRAAARVPVGSGVG